MDMMNDLTATANNINHIEYIFAENLNLTVLPEWITKTDKLKILNLNSNKISDAHLI